MKLWITGGAGFLGQRLTKHLVDNGNEVIALSRRQTPQSCQSYSIDLSHRSAVATLISLHEQTGAPDVVIHTASRQPGLKGDLTEYVKSNVTATSNLLEALKHSPPKQFIYTSTLTVYGRTNRNPVDETFPASGSLPYSATKRWAEQLIETADIGPRVVLRLPSIYGAGQEDSFIDGLAQIALTHEPLQLFAQGEVIRDALHVSDVVAAIQNCMDKPPTEDFVCMNLGCDQPVKTRQWATELVYALASRSPIEPLDIPARQFDLYANIELARNTIGFCPTELRESMKRYVAELRT
jgi:UDP-glucuronate 4-epimerase